MLSLNYKIILSAAAVDRSACSSVILSSFRRCLSLQSCPGARFSKLLKIFLRFSWEALKVSVDVTLFYKIGHFPKIFWRSFHSRAPGRAFSLGSWCSDILPSKDLLSSYWLLRMPRCGGRARRACGGSTLVNRQLLLLAETWLKAASTPDDWRAEFIKLARFAAKGVVMILHLGAALDGFLFMEWPWASAHRGKWGQLTPLEKMDEKLKSENMQIKSSFLLCYILRAIRAGRCRERRYADHIFIQIYFTMHHFVVKFSKFSSP